MLSVVIPALEEGATLDALVERLLGESGVAEVVVVEASAEDTGRSACSGDSDSRLRWLSAVSTGRAAQMNQGAEACRQAAICFLHADSIPPDGFVSLIQNALEKSLWGRFDIRLDHPARRYRLIETMINLRSRATSISTGDQGIFVDRAFFESLGGFARIPLMEDIEFSRRAARRERPALITNRLLTSARRWERHGTVRTILLMWKLRYLYWRGTDPVTLAKMYRNAR